MLTKFTQESDEVGDGLAPSWPVRQWMTVQETAEFCGVYIDTVRKAIERGERARKPIVVSYEHDWSGVVRDRNKAFVFLPSAIARWGIRR